MLQASQQKSGCDEQDQGERDLHDDKRAARELMPARDAHRVLRSAARHAGVEAVACRQETDEQTDQRGQTRGKGEHLRIDSDRADPG